MGEWAVLVQAAGEDLHKWLWKKASRLLLTPLNNCPTLSPPKWGLGFGKHICYKILPLWPAPHLCFPPPCLRIPLNLHLPFLQLSRTCGAFLCVPSLSPFEVAAWNCTAAALLLCWKKAPASRYSGIPVVQTFIYRFIPCLLIKMISSGAYHAQLRSPPLPESSNSHYASQNSWSPHLTISKRLVF